LQQSGTLWRISLQESEASSRLTGPDDQAPMIILAMLLKRRYRCIAPC